MAPRGPVRRHSNKEMWPTKVGYVDLFDTEVTLSFFLSGWGAGCLVWVARAPFLFAVCFSFSCASSFLFSLLTVVCVACFRFLMAALVVACLCYFVPVITVLLRFSFLRSVCCRVVGVRVFVWKGCGCCGW